MSKISLSLFLAIILSLSFVSALDFSVDNYKEYDSANQIVKIYDSGQLGEDTLLLESKLITPQVFSVVYGKDRKVAELSIIGYTGDYDSLEKAISQMNFYDLNNGNKKIQREFTYKIKEVYYENITSLNKVCANPEDNYVKDSKCEVKEEITQVEKERWYELGETKINKEITIGIFTEVLPNDKVEWIPIIAGKEINEWAVWQSTYNDGLVAYLPINEGTGATTKDVATGRFNGSIYPGAGGTWNTTVYLLNNSYQFGSSNITINGSPQISNYSNVSYTFWFYPTLAGCSSGYDNLLTVGTANDGAIVDFVGSTCQLRMYFPTGGGQVLSNGTAGVGGWQMLAFVSNNGTIRLYYNGGMIAESTNKRWTSSETRVTYGYSVQSVEVFTGLMDEFGIWNRSLTSAEILDMYNNGTGMTYPVDSDNRIMTATQSSPVNVFNTTSPTINISCNFTGNNYNNISNVELNVYDSSNNLDYTNTESLGAGIVSYNKSWTTSSLTDDTYNWACYGYGDGGTNASTSNRTFTIDSTKPIITITSPSGNQGIKSLPYNVTINYTANDLRLQSCWFNSTFNSTITYTPCNITNITSVPNGNTNKIYVYANDSFGNENVSFSEFYTTATTGSILFNASTYESSYEGFSITVNASSTISNPYFSYGGANYTATSISSGLNYTFSKQITAPLVDSTTNKSFYFGWFQGVDHYSTDVNNQTVYRTNFALCNGTYNNSVYLNVTFKDEDTLGNIRASIPTSTFNYYIDDSTVYRTLTFINNSANDNYAFCYTPSHKTLRTSAYLQYKNDTNFPQRIWNPSPLNLTNTTTNQVLYLLSSTDGLYTTFQVTDTSGNALSGVDISVTRVVGSTTETVGTGTTDAAGLFTIWVNPDFSHTFTFSKTGYTTFVYTTNPTQSSYTVSLSGGTNQPQVTDYSKGIFILIQPTSAYIYNATTYTFNFTISSNNWTLQSYGYALKYGNGTVADTKSGVVATGGYLASNVNVGNQTRMVMEYYYVINSTSINGSKLWIVEIPNDYSIKNFFTRVDTYTDANLLGIKGADGTDNFGKALLSVLILVLLTGGLTYRYGIANEATIMGAIFGVVLFLNTMNFIPNPSTSFLNGNVQLGDIVVYLVGAITIGMIFKEESQ